MNNAQATQRLQLPLYEYVIMNTDTAVSLKTVKARLHTVAPDKGTNDTKDISGVQMYGVFIRFSSA
jgi:hypothetical protein